MPTLILHSLLACSLFASAAGHAQQHVSSSKLPAPVSAAFAKKFNDVKSVKWTKDGSDYQADFNKEGKMTLASFDDQGNWIRTGVQLAAKELPDAVTRAIAKFYHKYKVTACAQVADTEHDIYYEVIAVKGAEILELHFANNGSELRMEGEKEKDEKDND